MPLRLVPEVTARILHDTRGRLAFRKIVPIEQLTVSPRLTRNVILRPPESV